MEDRLKSTRAYFNTYYQEATELREVNRALHLSNTLLKQNLAEKDQIEYFLRESEQRFRLLAENSTDMITRLTPDGQCLYVSPACERLLGYPPESLIGKSMYQLIHRSDAGKIKKQLAHAQSKDEAVTLTYRIQRHDGMHIWFETNVRLIRDQYSQTLTEMQAASRDVTLRIIEEKTKKYGKQLAQAYHLTSMEEMASGLAHEVNQPLAALVNYTQGCVRHLENGADPEKILAVMRKAVDQAERAGEIIHRLKRFFCKGELQLEPEKLNNLTRQAITYLRPELHTEKVTVTCRFAKRLPTVSVDPIQFQQVIINLIRNAIESMEAHHIEEKTIIIETEKTDAQTITLCIYDNGPGFSKAIAKNAFDSFYTTKKNGTGMGLAICRSIVEAHGWKIQIVPKDQSSHGCIKIEITS